VKKYWELWLRLCYWRWCLCLISLLLLLLLLQNRGGTLWVTLFSVPSFTVFFFFFWYFDSVGFLCSDKEMLLWIQFKISDCYWSIFFFFVKSSDNYSLCFVSGLFSLSWLSFLDFIYSEGIIISCNYNTNNVSFFFFNKCYIILFKQIFNSHKTLSSF